MKRRVIIALAMAVVSVSAIGSNNSSIAQAAEPPIVMAIIGDYGGGQDGERRVADLIDTWNVDFITTVGDNVYSSETAQPFTALENKVGKFYHEYLYPYNGRFGAGSPTGKNRFFPALGNHDWGDPGVPLLTCSSTNCSGGWTDYFNLPGNERYYDVRQGSLHLFVIDDYYLEPDGNSATSKQGSWLRDSLAASDAEWKVVVNHFPAYSSSGSTYSMRWPFEDWGVDVVVAGHKHIYERLEIGDILYYVNGLGGAGKGSIAGPSINGSKLRYNGDYGAMRVTVTAKQMKIEFVNAAATVIDSVTLTADGAPPPLPTPDPDNEVFDATDWPSGGDYDAQPPTTRVDQPSQNGFVSGAVTVGGTAFHEVGVRQVEIVVRNTSNGKYWNAVTEQWQTKFFRFGVYASPRGWRNVTWSYVIPGNKIGTGDYKVRAWARSYTGSGDSTGSNQIWFKTD